ncbi:ATP-dependent Clp protease proteolytic subunit [Rhabdochlamydiaceae symbiont of Dictyostelium giganteum]|uniref:ATP-dependent Clp protease proteolytic subunit n=1 Tax=Rhabdochlamydiaceae symbiont of Dictyostelium giganteum TaxID=3342349 RepID=UPI00384B9B86
MYILEEDDDETPQKPLAPSGSIDAKIDAALLKERRIFFCDAVDGATSKDVIRKLWYLEISDPGKPILLVINSPGGSVDSGFAIWDQVQMITSPVTTLITGLAASMGSILSLCAAPGRRFATQHARIMIHQPRIMGVIQGQASDLSIQAEEILKTRKQIIDIYVKATGKTVEEVSQAIDRDRWFSSEDALQFGLIDGIITSFNEL